MKYAVAERAEGDKILQVKAAEAEAEAKYLSGVGVAKQRKAIVDGLRTSIMNFHDNVQGSSTKDVMDLLLLTQVQLLQMKHIIGLFLFGSNFFPCLLLIQYFDMIRDVGSANHCRTTFVPTSRTLGDDVRNSLLQAGGK